MKSSPVVFDLFSGAGLFASAFYREGFQIGCSVELNALAANTFFRNLGHTPIVADITKIKPSGSCDVLIAGPPCQGFSTIGRPDGNDPRNNLGFEVVRWTKTLKPQTVVIENVAPFLQSAQWKKMKSNFQMLGYEISENVLNSFEYGAPQRRNRAVCLIYKNGVPKIKKLKEYGNASVREAWQGLSKIPNGKNNHYAPSPTPEALVRLQHIPSEGTRFEIPLVARKLFPSSLLAIGSNATDVWARMKWHEPSNTIRSCLHPSKGRYLHPVQHRIISLREAARLQTVEDSWFFEGSPYQVARQIGNGVPLALGRAIARAVYSTLK